MQLTLSDCVFFQHTVAMEAGFRNSGITVGRKGKIMMVSFSLQWPWLLWNVLLGSLPGWDYMEAVFAYEPVFLYGECICDCLKSHESRGTFLSTVITGCWPGISCLQSSCTGAATGVIQPFAFSRLCNVLSSCSEITMGKVYCALWQKLRVPSIAASITFLHLQKICIQYLFFN